VAALGKAAVVVCTKQFEPLATKLVAVSGFPHVPVLALPFPLDTRPEDEVRAVAAQYLPQLLTMIGFDS
jgi:hypothetical protein